MSWRFVVGALALATCFDIAFAQSQTPPTAQPGAQAAAENGGPGKRMKGFVGDISELTEQNSDFRRVLYTGRHLQLVVMSLKPGEDIGEEVHDNLDQFFRIEEGNGEVLINDRRTNIESDDAILVPAGAVHNITNTGTKPLRFYTLYGPPQHQDKTVRATKQDAERSEPHFDGKTTEASD